MKKKRNIWPKSFLGWAGLVILLLFLIPVFIGFNDAIKREGGNYNSANNDVETLTPDEQIRFTMRALIESQMKKDYCSCIYSSDINSMQVKQECRLFRLACSTDLENVNFPEGALNVTNPCIQYIFRSFDFESGSCTYSSSIRSLELKKSFRDTLDNYNNYFNNT